MAEKKSRRGAPKATGSTGTGGSQRQPAGNTRDAIVDALLKLAASDGWRDLSLKDIARESGVTLAALRQEFSSKTEILADLIRRTDEAVLARAETEVTSDNAHDRLFDVVMMRLEALAPHKSALRAIFKDAPTLIDDLPALIRAQAESKRWMLIAADLEPHGLNGMIQTAGLGMIYGRVLRTWVREEDAALPRTMAELDRLLRRGARVLDRLEAPMILCASAARLACTFGKQARELREERRRKRRARGDTASSGASA